MLSDAPRCRFQWPDWDYTNVTNPFLLTRNTLDRSMIGILRVPAGQTLPRGASRVVEGMGVEEIASLLQEDLLGRGAFESVSTSQTTVAGSDAARLSYAVRSASGRKNGVEYGFVRGGWFFHLRLLATDGPEYAGQLRDFEQLVSTFEVLE